MGKEQATPARPPFALADAAGIACRERPASTDWNPFGRALDEVVASRWLLMVGVFDYGAVTAYLLRAYGPPNVAPLDPVKHSDAWALDTGDGYVIEIEPRLVHTAQYQAVDARERERCVSMMCAHGVIRVYPTRNDAPKLTEERLDEWMAEFCRPIRVRDVSAYAGGKIFSDDDPRFEWSRALNWRLPAPPG